MQFTHKPWLDYQPRDRNMHPFALLKTLFSGFRLLLAVVAILIAVCYWLFGRHVSEVHVASGQEVLLFTSVPLPPEAKKVRAASADEGYLAPGFCHYVRFEAPVAVCRRYAEAILHGVPLGPPPQFDPTVDADIFWSLKWFDVNAARNVVGGRAPVKGSVEVWVDEDRGIFYFLESN